MKCLHEKKNINQLLFVIPFFKLLHIYEIYTIIYELQHPHQEIQDNAVNGDVIVYHNNNNNNNNNIMHLKSSIQTSSIDYR